VGCSELKLEGEQDRARAADLLRGLKPPLAPPESMKLASVCVEWPNRGLVKVLLALPGFGSGESFINPQGLLDSCVPLVSARPLRSVVLKHQSQGSQKEVSLDTTFSETENLRGIRGARSIARSAHPLRLAPFVVTHGGSKPFG